MVSVIVPVYNSEKTIKGLLDSILNQDYTGEYEVIVVDDGSTDSTASVVSQCKGARLIRQINAGPAAARNKGASNARGDIILFTDSDCEVFSNWIKEMVRPLLEDPEVVGVKGAYKTKQKELIARFVQLEYEDKYDKMKKERYIDFIDTYSAGFKRSIFLAIGGYDVSFPVACAEDVDLSYRLARKGYKMVFNPKARVFHKHPINLRTYLKKKFKFAYWRVKTVKKNPDKILKDSHTPFIMKLQVILFLIILLMIPLGFRYLYALMIMMGLYFITAVPFTFKAIKKDITVGFLSPFMLFLRSAAQLFGLTGGVIRERLDYVKSS